MPPVPNVHIQVKMQTIKSLVEIDLPATATVLQLNDAIRESDGIPVDQQRLITEIDQVTRHMLDHKLVQDYFPAYDPTSRSWRLNVELYLQLPRRKSS